MLASRSIILNFGTTLMWFWLSEPIGIGRLAEVMGEYFNAKGGVVYSGLAHTGSACGHQVTGQKIGKVVDGKAGRPVRRGGAGDGIRTRGDLLGGKSGW